MNRVLLSLFLILMTANTSAQNSIEVKTNDGRTVILKPDGSWEQKKDNIQPSLNPNTNSANGNIETNSLPPNFTGHDTGALFTKLSDLKNRLLKSEFETTSDYERRVTQEMKKLLLDNRTVTDTFSLVVSNIEASYDADSQEMQFFLPVEESYSSTFRRDKKTAYDLKDVNPYSIQWRDDGHYSTKELVFDEMGSLVLTTREYRKGFLAKAALGIDEAKRLKKMAKAVVIVQFEEPYVGYIEQLQVRLIDVYFFDPKTGNILAKISQGGKEK